jgi:hypothetical protein
MHADVACYPISVKHVEVTNTVPRMFTFSVELLSSQAQLLLRCCSQMSADLHQSAGAHVGAVRALISVLPLPATAAASAIASAGPAAAAAGKTPSDAAAAGKAAGSGAGGLSKSGANAGAEGRSAIALQGPEASSASSAFSEEPAVRGENSGAGGVALDDEQWNLSDEVSQVQDGAATKSGKLGLPVKNDSQELSAASTALLDELHAAAHNAISFLEEALRGLLYCVLVRHLVMRIAN